MAAGPKPRSACGSSFRRIEGSWGIGASKNGQRTHPGSRFQRGDPDVACTRAAGCAPDGARGAPRRGRARRRVWSRRGHRCHRGRRRASDLALVPFETHHGHNTPMADSVRLIVVRQGGSLPPVQLALFCGGSRPGIRILDGPGSRPCRRASCSEVTAGPRDPAGPLGGTSTFGRP
jgi:hypothetical protein